jgi:hypothetical protein|tara:strand:- start:526 stop:702 length:177 start_codon:yes stop_codon:yes gene_type:complete
MSVSDLIKSAMDKDAGSFESSFNGIMADKMTSAIETKYDSMFGATANSAEVDVESETE